MAFDTSRTPDSTMPGTGFGPTYSPLSPDEDEVRLISFNATDSHDLEKNDPLQCSVQIFSLKAYSEDYRDLTSATENGSHLRHLIDWTDSPPRYLWGDFLAMSHCWGEEGSGSNFIEVNGTPTKVSANLAAGLRSISQLPAVRNGKLKLWNDFLCLDQQNKDEIERELKHVPRIYSNAFAVISWIGPAADQSDVAMALLGRSHHLEDGLVAALKSVTSDEWQALMSLLQRPYWRRTWITQELTLAGKRTLLLCGNATAPLAQMWELVKVIIRNAGVCHRLMADALGTGDLYYDPTRHRVFGTIARLLYHHDIDHMRRMISDDSDFDLLPLLDVCRGSQQRYLRDLVYGILGLLPYSITRLIEPDINKAPHAIFTDLTLASFEALSRLDIMQNCVYNAQSPAYPTWTPDISVHSMTHTFGIRPIVDAGRDLRHQPRVSADRLTLTCSGLFVDIIDRLTPPQWPLSPVTSEERAAALPKSSGRPQEWKNVREVLWTALVSGSAGYPHDREPPLEYCHLLDLPWLAEHDGMETEEVAHLLIQSDWCTSDEIQDLITFVSFRQRAGRDFDVLGHRLGSFFPSVDKAERDSTSIQMWREGKMLRQACNALKHRRFFVSEGSRVGVCGPQARPGDLVVILRGCSTPLVLRQVSRSPDDDTVQRNFVVIGACYANGLMSGDWLDQHCGDEQEIVLI